MPACLRERVDRSMFFKGRDAVFAGILACVILCTGAWGGDSECRAGKWIMRYHGQTFGVPEEEVVLDDCLGYRQSINGGQTGGVPH